MSTVIHMNPDPDPDILVNAMSIGQYDISHQVATRLPILTCSPSTHIASNIGAIKEGLHTIPR